MNADELIATFTDWARHDPRVIAAALCGSYARGEAGPDSDVDLCIIARDPRVLLKERDWINAMGSGARVAGPIEDYGLMQSLRVRYGTTEAEFGVTDPSWIRSPLDAGSAAVINNGFRILFDPDQQLANAAIEAAASSPRG